MRCFRCSAGDSLGTEYETTPDDDPAMPRLRSLCLGLNSMSEQMTILSNQIGWKKHQQNHCRAERAFTFIEVVVAAFIVGLMGFSLFPCFSSGFTLVHSSRENLRATQIMLQRVEAARLFTWKQVLDTTNYLKPTFVDYYDPQSSVTNEGSIYQGFVTSSIPTDLPVAYRSNMRTITITLYWTNYNGTQAV